ncbi:MAG: inner membrane CreD family protein [Candidatus Wallbacteria bacterium]|nr:inner membrane CreD family protein [Candidatus Wallbacteria bacterium]
MFKRIMAIVFIFICSTGAWMVLGGITMYRSTEQSGKLYQAVGSLWGSAQSQNAPTVYYQTKELKKVENWDNQRAAYVTKTEEQLADHPITLEGSDILVDLALEYRKKGLLWYSLYKVGFSGTYLVKNTTAERRDIFFSYSFPVADGKFDSFKIAIDGADVRELQPTAGTLNFSFNLAPEEQKKVLISYVSQGQDQWWYRFGYNVSQIRNFNLVMNTDFPDIDFPENSIAPIEKVSSGKGWKLTWKYGSLISGIQIGMDLPKKLNPGPFAGKVSFFAPVSLFLFFFLMFVITSMKGIRLHPMNYFFLAAAFFSFHLLLSYLADHLDIHAAMAVCSVVSIFLVVSYMRLVTGARFAFIEAGISQLVYLVLFSYAFFLEGYTGLSITVVCIVTLFVIMQLTGKIDWEAQFKK